MGEGNGRVGYYTVTSDGTSTLTFNATSIQNGVILGFLVLVLGALILPLLGVNLFSFEDEFTSASTTDSTAYGQSYYNFAKRTGMDLMGPVLSAINKGRKKYGKKNEEEQEIKNLTTEILPITQIRKGFKENSNL